VRRRLDELSAPKMGIKTMEKKKKKKAHNSQRVRHTVCASSKLRFATRTYTTKKKKNDHPNMNTRRVCGETGSIRPESWMAGILHIRGIISRKTQSASRLGALYISFFFKRGAILCNSQGVSRRYHLTPPCHPAHLKPRERPVEPADRRLVTLS